MKIVIMTDSWLPQVSGVVTCWVNVVKELEKLGHDVKVVSHKDFGWTVPIPTYPELKMPLDVWSIMKILEGFDPDLVHISTPEGTIGLAGRIYCSQKKYSFTTCYHTRIPEYVRARYPIPLEWSYAYERMVHSGSRKILVTTKSMREELIKYGLPSDKLIIWPRGVDTNQYNSSKRVDLGYKKPVLLYVGRVSVEKNIDEFLDLGIEGTKVVVGDGPQLPYLKRRYPEVVFTGYKFGDDLAMYYASADVFVFPSYSDTFGIVLLESLASGTPVASHDAPGPKDVLTEGVNGYFSLPLKNSIEKCLELNRSAVEDSSKVWSWGNCAKMFLDIITN